MKGDAAAHPAYCEFLGHRLNRVIGYGNEDVVCQGGQVAKADGTCRGCDKGGGAVCVIGGSPGDSDRRQAGICEEPPKGLGDPAGSDDRGARSGHLIAENVRFSQAAKPVTTSALTLRSVSAPYSFTSPVTAGTIRWLTPLTISSSTAGESLSFWAI